MDKNLELKEYSFKEPFKKQLIDLYIHCFNDEEKNENWTYETAEEYFISRTKEESSFFGIFDHDMLIATVVGSAYKNSFISNDLNFNRENDFYISLIATHDNYRGQGLAKKIMDFSIDKVKRKNFNSLSVRCRSENMPVQGLLKKLNFIVKHSYISQLGGVECERLFLTNDKI